jgi:hypothetical protein
LQLAGEMRAVFVVMVLVVAGTAHASGGFIPPMEVDYGKVATFDGGRETEMLAGIHWGSLAWEPTSIEIGVGYIGITRDMPVEAIGRGVTTDDNTFRLDGGYLTLGKTIGGGNHWRTWLLARGELLHASTGESVLGEAMRITTELYGAGAAGGSGAAIVGAFAIGIYAEVAHRDVPDGFGPTGLSTGLTLRIPMMVAN